jgi:hypothetical protein
MTFSIIARGVPVNDFGRAASDDLTVHGLSEDTGGRRIVQELQIELFCDGAAQPKVLRG